MSELRKRREDGEEKPVESAESDHVSHLIYFLSILENKVLSCDLIVFHYSAF